MNCRILGTVLMVALLVRLAFGLSRSGLEASTDETHWVHLAQILLEHGPLHPDTGKPQVFIYDGHAGGIGIA